MDRRWVYGALGVAAGVGLLRALVPSRPRIVPGQSRVLIVGDSLAVGLAPHLGALAKEQRVAFDSMAKVGTRIDQWAQNDKLSEKLQAFQPTIVLVSLGTNDEYMAGDGATKQRPFLEQLIQRIERYTRTAGGQGPEHLVWIGPPTLPKAASNGVVPMIVQRIPRTHYFPSERLTIPRGPDHLHPTPRGYAGWAGTIWQWLS